VSGAGTIGPDPPPPGTGAATAATGTPYPVDLARDRRARLDWLVFLAGPVIWFGHFMVVYLVAEAGCTGGGPGFEVFDPPVPEAFTLVATGAAVVACGAFAVWSWRWWRTETGTSGAVADLQGDGGDGGGRGSLAFAGLLLSALSALAVVFVGLPAAFLAPC
jgi:hypothetical protein